MFVLMQKAYPGSDPHSGTLPHRGTGMTEAKQEQNDDQPDFYKDIPVPFAVFQLIYDSSHTRVVNTRYKYVNEVYCRIAGFSWEELIGRYFLDLYPDGTQWFPYCQEAFEKKKAVQAFFYSEETKRWFDFTVGPAAGRDSVAFVFNDVDETVRKNRRERTTDTIILRISKLLNNEEGFDSNMNHALKELSRFIHPDRLYILETDGKTVSNTFEWCAPGITPEIETLQNMEYGPYLSGWEKYLKKDSDVIIPDIEELKTDDREDYENLKRQGIRCLAAAPFYNRGRLIGYLGADNYKQNDLVNTQMVLNSISYFIGAKIVNHRLMEDLNRLGRMDALTGVYNHNAMLEKIHVLSSQNVPVGLVYSDVNSLKFINDSKGHEFGDQALCHTAEILVSCFGRENVYRAGGDEFVVILPGIGQKVFTVQTGRLTAALGNDIPNEFSFGVFWCPDSARIREAVRMADHEMYENKSSYYQMNGLDRRRKNTWKV